MLNGRHLLAALDTPARAAALGSTGVDELDILTGGLGSGRVWLVAGTVGEGKTTLVTQWALTIAQQGRPVQLVCPREPAA